MAIYDLPLVVRFWKSSRQKESVQSRYPSLRSLMKNSFGVVTFQRSTVASH